MKIHPRHSLLRELLDSPRKRLKPVLEHVESCAKCKARLAVLATANRFRRPAEEVDYGPALDRAYEAFSLRQMALDRERSEAPRLLARLLMLIPERQQLLLRNSRRFRTWGLFELLIQYARDETFVDPEHAEEILHLALDLSIHLASSFYGRERIEDMRARTWGLIGNARRANAALVAAEEAFEEASSRLHRSSGDVMEQAILFNLQSSLRRYQQRHEEALQLSRRAIAIFSRAGEDHLTGKALVNLSLAHHWMGNSKEALAVLCRSLELIDPVREPRVAANASHNLVEFLATAGHFIAAQRLLARARPFYRLFPESRFQSRRLWTEAKIAFGFGRYEEAEELMVKAQNGFLSANAAYDGELASRELASIRARKGRAYRNR